MKFKVIEITFQGKTGYLANNSCLFGEPTVADPMKALMYKEGEENELNYALKCLYLTGVGGAKSGVRADSADVVEFEVEIKEVFRENARQGKMS